MSDYTYDNFCLPHARVRQPLWVPEPPNGRGSVKGWRPYTPAMAARWTDHVRSLTEVWLSRVPPWPQPQTVEEAVSVDAHGVEPLPCAPREARRLGRGGAHLFRGLLTGCLARCRRVESGPDTCSARLGDTTLHYVMRGTGIHRENLSSLPPRDRRRHAAPPRDRAHRCA